MKSYIFKYIFPFEISSQLKFCVKMFNISYCLFEKELFLEEKHKKYINYTKPPFS